MLIAQEKQKSNIIEYILYMWQVEDMIRSCNHDISIIQTSIIDRFGASEEMQVTIRRWYVCLIEMMAKEGIKDIGHLKMLNEIIGELTYLHQMCSDMLQEPKYLDYYNLAKPNIEELGKRTGFVTNEIEICLNGLYGVLLLKLQKKQISEETKEGMKTISDFLGYMAAKYIQMQKGNLEIPPAMKN